MGHELPTGRSGLELVVSRAALLGTHCPCADGGACACQEEIEDTDVQSLAEKAARGNPLPFDTLPPED